MKYGELDPLMLQRILQMQFRLFQIGHEVQVVIPVGDQLECPDQPIDHERDPLPQTVSGSRQAEERMYYDLVFSTSVSIAFWINWLRETPRFCESRTNLR